MSENKKSGKEYEKYKELVIARIEIMPSNYKLSLGSEGTFDKDELMHHVNKVDHIGIKVIQMELRFIKAIAEGKLTKALVSA